MVRYQYQRIKVPLQTRILRIAPGAFEDKIRCSILHIDLSPTPSHPYDALSYCWAGSKIDESTGNIIVNATKGVIQCDAVDVEVGYELHSALKHLRSADKELNLWVDALCINQDDIDERNGHVKAMALIYSSASKVRIWLGDDDGTGQQAVEVMLVVDEVLDDFRTRTDAKGIRGYSMLDACDFYVHDRVQSIDWVPLRNLLARSWFERTWIIQEAALSKSPKATIHVGEVYIIFEDFLSVLVRLLAIGGLRYLPHCRAQAFSNMITMIRTYGREDVTSPPLLTLLGQTRAFKSTDPLDKIYGILSLAGERDIIRVDYSLSPAELFQNVAQFFIDSHKSLDILAHCTPKRKSGIQNLPSWVPDWTIQKWHSHLYNEMTGLKVPEPFKFQGVNYSPDGVLHAKGLYLDQIQVIDKARSIPFIDLLVQTTSLEPGKEHPAIAEYRSYFKSMLDIACQIPLGTKRLENLWRTFICDGLAVEELPRPGIEKAFLVLMRAYTLRDLYKDFPEATGPGTRTSETRNDTDDEELQKDLRDLMMAHGEAHDRRFFRTKLGRFGWAPDGTLSGDQVVVLYGSTCPLIIRSVGNGLHEVLGDCYCHGSMDSQSYPSDIEEQLFHLC